MTVPLCSCNEEFTLFLPLLYYGTLLLWISRRLLFPGVMFALVEFCTAKRLTEDINMLHAIDQTDGFVLQTTCFFVFGFLVLVGLPQEEFWKLLSISHSFKRGLDCYTNVEAQMHL